MSVIPVDIKVQPNSSFIESVCYKMIDSNEISYGDVWVTIGNTSYKYEGVSTDAFTEFAHADSVGHEYHYFSSANGPSTEAIVDAEFEVVLDEDDLEEAVVDGTGATVHTLNIVPLDIDELIDDEDFVPLEGRAFALSLAVDLYSKNRKPVSVNQVFETAEQFLEWLND